MYYAADRRSAISEDAAFGNVSSYESRGYTLRKVGEGLSVIAFIKDGVVNDIVEAPNAESALVIAAMGNSFAWVNELLIYGADPDTRDEYGNTALIYAAINDNADVARILLEAGANPSLQDKNGDTALAFATRNGHTETAKVLRSAGAQKVASSRYSPPHPSTSTSASPSTASSSSSSSGSSDYNWGISVGVSKPVSGILANYSNIGLSVSFETGNKPLLLLLQGDYYTFNTQSILASAAVGWQFFARTLGIGVYGGGGAGATSSGFSNFDNAHFAWKVFGGVRLLAGPVFLRTDVSYVKDEGIILGAFAGYMF